MADPRPTSDDPLIIFGSVTMPARQGPSTVNPNRGGIPDFGDPHLGCHCLCCPPLPPGCQIGPLPCEDTGELLAPFPDRYSCGTACSPASAYSLVLSSSGCVTVTSPAGTVLSFDTITHNRGFNASGTVTSVTIPKTGLWATSFKAKPCGSCNTTYLMQLLLCCVECGRFTHTQGLSCTVPGFQFTTVRPYTAGKVLKVKGNRDGCSVKSWSGLRWSLHLIGEAC